MYATDPEWATEDHEFSDNETLDDALNEGVPEKSSVIERPQAGDTIADRVTRKFLAQANIEKLRERDPLDVSDEILALINVEIGLQNARMKDSNDSLVGIKVTALQRLNFPELAQIVAALHWVILLRPSTKSSDPDLNVLAVYDDDETSEHFGTYQTTENHLLSIVRRYSKTVTVKGFSEIVSTLRAIVPVKSRGSNQDLVACKNGIVDVNGGNGPIFMKFSPEHVFVSKFVVNWNEDATSPVIHNDEDGTDWEFDAWLDEVTGDTELSTLIWEVVSASLRPYVRWMTCVFFYATKGNNGKGTLIALIRRIIGEGNYASIPLSDFGKDFLLEPLTRASAILVDENDVGAFLEKGANYKAIITNDVITINRKYKAAIAHQHFGLMVQCLNDHPTIKDKSESLYRRQTFVPFLNSFTGRERKYIKADYLNRTDVLEYVLKTALSMGHYKLSTPQAVLDEMASYRIDNDPVYAFWDELKNEFKWDLLPLAFAFDVFKAWFKRNYPSGKVVSKTPFVNSLRDAIAADPDGEWVYPETASNPGVKMMADEPLIKDYDLEFWMYPRFKKGKLASSYRGPRRVKSSIPPISGSPSTLPKPPKPKPISKDEERIRNGAMTYREYMDEGRIPMLAKDDSVEDYAAEHRVNVDVVRRIYGQMYISCSPFAAVAGDRPSWGDQASEEVDEPSVSPFKADHADTDEED